MQAAIFNKSDMKKHITALLAFIGILIFIVACSNPDEKETNPLIGYWYTAYNDRAVSLRIDENGTGEATFYIYNGEKWEKETSLLQYTVANGDIAIKAGKDYTLSGRMAITGASFSITNGNDVSMFTEFDGNEEIIDKLKAGIESSFDGNSKEDSTTTSPDGEEENSTTIQPSESIEQENFWYSENDVLAILSSAYIKTVSFELSQLNIENIRITGKNLTNHKTTITATTPEIAECWKNVYDAIGTCNAIIENANEEFVNLINEARALRCFLYYNTAHLWGKAPYITATDIENVGNSPVLSKEEIFDRILREIDETGTFETGYSTNNYRIDKETLRAIKGEIHLSRGEYGTALSYLYNIAPSFSLSITGGSFESYRTIFGDEIAIYTPEYIELLRFEAENTDETLSRWEKSDTPAYGHWAMLRRTGKAQEICGCEEHELLLPIPKDELIYNPNLTQNPGY